MRFLRALLGRYRRKVALFPRAYDPGRADGVGSIRDFDEQITAFYSGFTSADDYYFRAAGARVLDRIAVPALIINAADDPFVRLLPASREMIADNAKISFIESRHGGHCAFLARPDKTSGYDGYWAEHSLLRFLLDHA
jgi:predicted alpha/beta-fold hydrolase